MTEFYIQLRRFMAININPNKSNKSHQEDIKSFYIVKSSPPSFTPNPRKHSLTLTHTHKRADKWWIYLQQTLIEIRILNMHVTM